MWKFFDSTDGKVYDADDMLATAASEFIENEQTQNVYVSPGRILQYPSVIRFPFDTGKKMTGADLKLCIFTDEYRASCLFTDPPLFDTSTPVNVENDYNFFYKKDKNDRYRPTGKQAGDILYGWISGETMFRPHDMMSIVTDAFGDQSYFVYTFPKDRIAARATALTIYNSDSVSAGILSWAIKYANWTNIDFQSLVLRKKLEDWVRNGTGDFDYKGVKLEYPARIGFNKETKQWQLHSGKYYRLHSNDLLLEVPNKGANDKDADVTPQATEYYMKYQNMSMEMSRVLANWASQQSEVSKHDVFILFRGDIYALQMPEFYDRYDRKTPIKAINISKNQAFDFYPEPEAGYEDDDVLEVEKPKAPAPPKEPKRSGIDSFRIPTATPPAAPPATKAKKVSTRGRKLAPAAKAKKVPNPELPQAAPPAPPQKTPEVYKNWKKDPAIPEEGRAPLRKRDLDKYEKRSMEPDVMAERPSSPGPKVFSKDAPLRKRDLDDYDSREREVFEQPKETSTVEVLNDQATVQSLIILRTPPATVANFENWMENGRGNFRDDQGRQFVYPGKVGKFSRASNQFFFYATSTTNELEMIYTEQVPRLVPGILDTGKNIIYRLENGLEFSRLESQAIYKWKTNRRYRHQILFAASEPAGTIYVLDYDADTATVHVPGVDPYKVSFQAIVPTVRLKRGKYTECSICAKAFSEWKCVCSGAYYCSEECAAKDEEAHKMCV